MKKVYILYPEDLMINNMYGVIRENGEGIASFIADDKSQAEEDIAELRKLLMEEKGGEEFTVLRLGEDEMTREELLQRNLNWDMDRMEQTLQETKEEEEIKVAISKLDPDIFNKIKIKVNYDSTRHGDISINFQTIAIEIGKILNKKVPVEKVTEIFFKALSKPYES